MEQCRSAWTLLACAAVLSACGDEDTAEITVGSQPSASRESDDRGARSRASDDGLDAHGALAFLPADSLFALRVPRLDLPEGTWEGTALAQALQNAGMGQLPVGPMLDGWVAQMRQSEPLVGRWIDVARALEGEVVVGVTELDPAALSGPGDALPLTLALWIELGDQAKEVQRLIAETSQSPQIPAVWQQRGEGWSLQAGPMEVEIGVFDGYLGLCVAPPGSGGSSLRLAQWRNPSGASFASSAVVSKGQRPATSVVEAFVHTAPLWPMMLAAAPGEVQQGLAAFGLSGIDGLSMRTGISGEHFHDFVHWHSDGQDLISSLMGSAAIRPQFASAAPAGASAVQVAHFDAAAALARLRERLPEEWTNGLEQGLSEASAEMGWDVEQTLIDSFGPHMVLSTQGRIDVQDPSAFQFSVAVECKDAQAVGRLVKRLQDELDFSVRAEQDDALGLPYRRIVTEDPSFPWQLCYTKAGPMLLVASDPILLGSTYRSMKDGGRSGAVGDRVEQIGPNTWCLSIHDTSELVAGFVPALMEMNRNVSELSQAAEIAPPGVVAMLSMLQISEEGVRAFAESLPDFVSTVSRTEHGHCFEAQGPVPSVWAGVVPLAIGSAIAIPNLLSARLEANEAAAVATLRNVCAAQTQGMAMAACDRDADGAGEAMSFTELSGAQANSGMSAPMMPPLLSSSFQPVADGAVQKSGYCYRMYLPDSSDRPIAEKAYGGSPVETYADNAEHHWWACAWPVEAETTGTALYTVSHAGELYTSSAVGEYQVDPRAGLSASDFLPSEGEVAHGQSYYSESGRLWWPVQ